MKTYKHLVFDIDGTLLDSVKIDVISLQAALKELRGETVPLDKLLFSFGIPGLRTMEILGFEDAQAALDVWLRHYNATADRLGMPLFPGIEEVLQELRKKDVSLGIITSKIREEYEEHFGEKGLLSFFDCAITSSDTKRGKPYPDPMNEYLRRTGASKEEVLFFGDTVYDMDCARSAGTDCALVLWGCPDPEGIEADWRLEKPEEILAFAAGNE